MDGTRDGWIRSTFIGDRDSTSVRGRTRVDDPETLPLEHKYELVGQRFVVVFLILGFVPTEYRVVGSTVTRIPRTPPFIGYL